MIPLNVLIATVCLTNPTIELTTPPAPLSAFRGVAVQLELMDAKESGWIFARDEDFAADYATIRQRAIELRDAPPACDAARFPSAHFCREQCQRNAVYRDWLADRRLIDHSPWIDEAMIEAESLYRAWDLAADAQTAYYYVPFRREKLLALRALLGVEVYYAGGMPHAIPVWRCWRSD